MSIVDITAAGSVPAVRTEGTEPETLRTPTVIFAEINLYSDMFLTSAIEIGRRMAELKEQLPHGTFGAEVEKNTPWSRSHANNFMRLYREYGSSNVQSIGHLSPTKALRLLALPESEREEFVSETHQVNGEEKTVGDMSVRELEQAIRERDAARREAQEALAEMSMARQARDRLSAEVKLAAHAKLQAEQALERAREEADQAADAVLSMERKLAEWKQRPVEVAVEVDQAAVEQARAEAAAEMQAKVDQLQADLDKAAADRDSAVENRLAAEQALAKANAKLAAAAKAEKKQAMATDEDMSTFKVLFGQAQEQANKMRGILIKLRTREDQTAAAGVQKAMLALADAIGRAAV